MPYDKGISRIVGKLADDRRELLNRLDERASELGKHRAAELALLFADPGRRGAIEDVIDKGLESATDAEAALATVVFYEKEETLVLREEQYARGSRVFIGTDEPETSTVVIAVPSEMSGLEPSKVYDEKMRAYGNDGTLSHELAERFSKAYAQRGYRCSAVGQCCTWDGIRNQVAYGSGFDVYLG